jgi:L-cysteine desulfidase
MAGLAVEVMISAGSGNQGIVATMSVVEQWALPRINV